MNEPFTVEGATAIGAVKPTRPIGEAIAELREAIDSIEAIEDGALASLKRKREDLTAEILNAMKYEGLDSQKAAGLSCTLKQRTFAQYDPERWNDLVQWAGSLGRGDLIQRRLNDSRLLELMDSGTVLPDYVKFNTVPQLLTRRS